MSLFMVSVVILGGGLGASEADDDLVSLNSTEVGIIARICISAAS